MYDRVRIIVHTKDGKDYNILETTPVTNGIAIFDTIKLTKSKSIEQKEIDSSATLGISDKIKLQKYSKDKKYNYNYLGISDTIKLRPRNP